jgi:hypothetical protein
MQAAIAALDRGHTQRQRRTDQVTAIEQGDPVAIASAMLGIAAQAAKLERIESRLERMAAAAEAGRSPTGVATLAAQQLRGVEVGSRLAGVGGYAPSRTANQAPVGEKFSIIIQFSGGRREEIAIIPSPTAVEGEIVAPDGEQPD